MECLERKPGLGISPGTRGGKKTLLAFMYNEVIAHIASGKNNITKIREFRSMIIVAYNKKAKKIIAA